MYGVAFVSIRFGKDATCSRDERMCQTSVVHSVSFIGQYSPMFPLHISTDITSTSGISLFVSITFAKKV